MILFTFIIYCNIEMHSQEKQIQSNFTLTETEVLHLKASK